MRMIIVPALVGFVCLMGLWQKTEVVRSKPSESAPSRVAIGSVVSDEFHFKDIRFKERKLSEGCFKDKKAFVFVCVNNGCPLVPRYFPLLSKLEKQYREQGVQFFALNVGLDETLLEIASQATEYEVDFPFIKDIEGNCIEALGVERTPEIVILDAKKTIRYRGRINDQFAPGKTLPQPTREDFQIALDEVLAGKKVSIPSTTCDGCKISRPSRDPEEGKITYAEHIAPLIHKNCLECHKPGGLGPFSMLTYEQVNKRAEMIQEVVADGQMPPWYAVSSHSKLINERSLNAEERSLFTRWVAGGKTRGDESKLAKPNIKPAQKEDWAFGKPDLILTTEVEEIPAEGDVPYRYMILPHYFDEETYIESIEIKPDNPKVVHHANLLYFSTAEPWPSDRLFITGYVPGNRGMDLEKGMAYRVPKRSQMLFQTHFVSTGKVEKTRLSIGIRFPKQTIDKTLKHLLLDVERFKIPAHHPAYHLKVKPLTLQHDAIGVAMFTHMHKLGKSMVFKAKAPQEDEQTLLMVPNYNFDWQMPYKLEPNKIKLPKGSTVWAEAVFDNSAYNTHNPNPARDVPAGFQTYNEMLQGFFFYVDANENLKLEVDPKTGLALKK